MTKKAAAAKSAPRDLTTLTVESNWRPARRRVVENTHRIPFEKLTKVGQSMFIPTEVATIGKVQSDLLTYRLKNKQKRSEGPWISVHIQRENVSPRKKIIGVRLYKAR